MAEEHPIVKLLREDRQKEEAEISESIKDYHTTITYLGAGALGFFLTIHETFFALPESRLFWLFVVSIALLFSSLLLYLMHILLKFHNSSKLRDEEDQLITGFDFDNSTQDEQDTAQANLDVVWEKGEKTSRRIMYWRLTLVLLGVAGEIIFMIGNLQQAKAKDEKRGTIRIEIPVPPNKGSISIDTSEKNNIQLRFQNL